MEIQITDSENHNSENEIHEPSKKNKAFTIVTKLEVMR